MGILQIKRYTVCGHTFSCQDFGEEVSSEEVDDPLARIDEIKAEFKAPQLSELPVFTGGLVGYFGYERSS